MGAEYPVYVVDDDADLRGVLHFICAEQGIEALSFESGEQFLAALDDLGPGCVLLDMRMPRKNGLQVQADMRARGREMPVVAITGYGDVEMAVQSMRLGAIDFLEKPFEAAVLVEALERGIHRLEETERDDSPWYPSARLFRQERISDWDAVVARVRMELDRFIAAQAS